MKIRQRNAKNRGGRQGGKRHTLKEVGQVTESFAVNEREGREAVGAGKRRREARP